MASTQIAEKHSSMICIEQGCNANIEWNGRGRPAMRCPPHRRERARWIKVRANRRARAIAAGTLAATQAVCIEPGCEAVMEDIKRPRGGRRPDRCPRHRNARRQAMRKMHRHHPGGIVTQKLLDAPAGPGRGAPQRAAAERDRSARTENPKMERPHCGCGRRLHGAKAQATKKCRECRTPDERHTRDKRRARCACGRTLRRARSLDSGTCWACRAAAAAAQRATANAQSRTERQAKNAEAQQRTHARKLAARLKLAQARTAKAKAQTTQAPASKAGAAKRTASVKTSNRGTPLATRQAEPAMGVGTPQQTASLPKKIDRAARAQTRRRIERLADARALRETLAEDGTRERAKEMHLLEAMEG